jgi:hypothetical protein
MNPPFLLVFTANERWCSSHCYALSVREKFQEEAKMTISSHFPFVISAAPTVAKRILSKERIEEAAGMIFIATSFFLTGWFYYNLYQALHDYGTF